MPERAAFGAPGFADICAPCLIQQARLQGSDLAPVGAPEQRPGHLLRLRLGRLQPAQGAPEENCKVLTQLGFAGSSPDSSLGSRKLSTQAERLGRMAAVKFQAARAPLLLLFRFGAQHTTVTVLCTSSCLLGQPSRPSTGFGASARAAARKETCAVFLLCGPHYGLRTSS